MNIRTLTSVEIISISYNDFNEILHANQQFRRGIQLTLTAHMQIFEKSLLRKKGRLPDISPIERSMGQGELFKYDLTDEEMIDHGKLAFDKPFMNIGEHIINEKYLICCTYVYLCKRRNRSVVSESLKIAKKV